MQVNVNTIAIFEIWSFLINKIRLTKLHSNLDLTKLKHNNSNICYFKFTIQELIKSILWEEIFI